MNGQVLISLAIDGREQYVLKQKGLLSTLHVVADSTWWIFNQYPEGVTLHEEIPYLFKYDLIQKAVDEGYTKVCWADSTMRFLQNPFELLEQSEKGIVAFHNLGHDLYPGYISDLAEFNLRPYFRDEQEDRYKIKQTWGGLLLFDFAKPYAHKILAAVFHQATIGSFSDNTSARPGFIAHRHDQAVLSVLFNFYKIPLLDYGIIAARKDVTENTYIQYG